MNAVANTLTRVAAAAILSITFAAAAQAQVTFVGSQAAFDMLGTATQNTNFDAYATGVFSTPGSPFTVGDLTFVAGGQTIIGGVGSYGFARNMLTDNYVSGTTIQIDGAYDLFALNAGNFFGAGNANFTVTTNLSSYQFVQNVSDSSSLSFIGFQAGAGEYFTSVAVSGGNATGMTDIQLAQAVPEPETYALMLAGLGAMAFVARRRRPV